MDISPEHESINADATFHPPAWKKPLVIIGAVFVLLILVISIIPWYNLTVNPPPDMAAIEAFELTDAERANLENVEYEATDRVSSAIEQTDIFDYRLITTRLASTACSTHSDLCYSKAIYYYVQDMLYVSDPESRQYVQSPAETLLASAGDCEDMALLYAAMAESIGIDADIGVTSNHAFVRVRASSSLWGGEGYSWLDPTSNNAFGDVSFASKDVKGWYEVA